ncbi:hypothetical protein, partial [Porphyromonas sp. CAG:1061]|uniref:hypothetical protein n=1 Tax=Porphyromonas sp. CAG:1061 TaxID=1262916 RepID=UPI00258402FC
GFSHSPTLPIECKDNNYFVTAKGFEHKSGFKVCFLSLRVGQSPEKSGGSYSLFIVIFLSCQCDLSGF